MRTELPSYLLLLIGSLLLAGCGDKNDPDNGTNPVPEGDYLRATFNGQTWTSTEVNAFETPMFNSLNIAALREATPKLESVAFSVTGIKGTGTYKINPVNCATQMNMGGVTYATGLDTTRTYGTLTITAYGNGRIAGTFNFTAYKNADVSLESLTVTDGSFRAALAQ